MMLFKKIALFLLLAMTAVAQMAYAYDDAILAVVNDEALTVKDLRDYLKSIYAQLRIEGRSPQEIQEIMAQYEEKGVGQLIDDKLILDSAEKSGMIIRQKAIEDRMEEIKKRYPSTKDFTEAVIKEGMTISEVRKKIENQYKGQFMVDKEVRQKIAVNPQEVTEYFNTHASEFSVRPRLFLESIFVKKVFGREEAKAKVDKALEEIKSGGDFKAVAAKYSELPSVGEIAQDDIRQELREKIQAVPLGGTTDIIEVDNGFYIFKVEGRDMGREASLKDVKDKIYQQLYEEKFRRRFKEWLDGLRKKAYVEIKK